jgi:hypothetical protein
MKTNMKKISYILGAGMLAFTLATSVSSCKKKSSSSSDDEQVVISQPLFSIGQPVDNSKPLCNSIKGTMKEDQEYHIGCDVTVNKGDTLLVQQGAKIYFDGNYSIIVRGSIISLGTKEKPVWFTVKDVAKTDYVGASVLTDPAYQGKWGGILGDTSTKMMIFKWTHVEFGCGPLATSPVYGMAGGGKPAYMINQVNPNGLFVFEDSWMYGGVDDPCRIQGGQVHIMRSTFEKGGLSGGECFNIKSGTVGNIAYNLMIGASTNGIKPSNNGARGQVTTIYAYNNTIVECGYRRSSSGRGGSINFEEGSRGKAYNNLIVNGRYGLRIVGYDASYSGNALKAADVSNIAYGYNYNYADSASNANQIYPIPFSTIPQSTDIPAIAGWISPNYITCVATQTNNCDIYNGTQVVGQNDPQFVNFPVKQNRALGSVAYAKGFDFRLKSTSPAIGKGFTGFTPLADGITFGADKVTYKIKVDPKFGATEITLPGKDIGAYQADGTGNQH